LIRQKVARRRLASRCRAGESKARDSSLGKGTGWRVRCRCWRDFLAVCDGNDIRIWRSDPGKHMFGLMNRRFIRSLVYVLLAGQVLLSAPMVSALTNGMPGSLAEMPCADSMPQTDDSKPCPCCPEGTVGAAACLSACTASVAALPALTVQIYRAPLLQAPMPVAVPVANLAEPPLNPPPIA
jgi:hypothetical protein